MSVKTIAKNLEKALLNNGEMRRELYEWEVEEHLAYFQASLIKDNDDFLFVVTEHTNDVAMLLIEKSGQVHINEAARERLKELWKATYVENMKMLIPDFANLLHAEHLAVYGVKTAGSSEH